MRRIAVGLIAVTCLAACNQAPGSEQAAAAGAPAPITFDGTGYTSDAQKVAHGARLAVILDCTGCHGSNLQGKNVTKDEPTYGQMNAPNITLLLAKYRDADFERLIRHGIPKDGREFWFMPVESFQFLSDADLAAIVAYLRTFQPAGSQLPPIVKGKGFYEDIERGFGNAQSQIERYRAKQPPDLGAEHDKGRYIAKVVCTACHNNELQGYEGFSPNLDLAGAYSESELDHLLTTGEGKAKKNLGMMSDMARNHFSRLTPTERIALIRYVKARAERPQ